MGFDDYMGGFGSSELLVSPLISSIVVPYIIQIEPTLRS